MSLFFIIPLFIIIAVSAIISNRLNDHFILKNPDFKPFAWGYFVAIIAFTFPTLITWYLTELYGYGNDIQDTSPWIEFFLGGIIMLPLSIGMYKRYQLAWALYFILPIFFFFVEIYLEPKEKPEINGNIIITIATFIYIKNRWQELKPIWKKNTPLKNIKEEV